MQLSISLGLTAGSLMSFATDRPFTVINGLLGGVAIPGQELSAQMSDESEILSQSWGRAPDDSHYGTAVAPSDFRAGDGDLLYLSVTTDSGTFYANAPIRMAAPSVRQSPPDLTVVQNVAMSPLDLADFLQGDQLTFELLSPLPEGLTVTGSILEGTPVAVVTEQNISVRATNSGGSVTLSFALTVSGQAATQANISVMQFQPAQKALYLTSDHPSSGTYHWARQDSLASAAVPDGSGGWIGPVLSSGTLTGKPGETLLIPEDGTTGQQYTLRLYQRIGGRDSTVVTQQYIASNTAPVLSRATVTAATDGAEFGLSSDTVGGILYRVATGAPIVPTAAQIMAGQDHTGAIANNALSTPIMSSGAQPAWRLSDIAVGQSVYVYAIQEDAHGNVSTILGASYTVVDLLIMPEDGVMEINAYPGLAAVTATAGAGSINIKEAA